MARMRIVIDVQEERVKIGAVERRGQWLEFYVLLALARADRAPEQAIVTAEEVANVGVWRDIKPESVGKQIARHLLWLKKRRLGGTIASREKTKAWRLGSEARVSFVPDLAAARAWVAAKSSATADAGEWLEHLRVLVEATATLQRGGAEAVLRALRGRTMKGSEPAFRAWRALLRGRAAVQHDAVGLLDQLRVNWAKRTDAPARTVSARLRALTALRQRFTDPSAELATLGRLAAQLERRGDVGALASVLNVMGLLARRGGDPQRASSLHLRAVAMFGIVGDYPSLQAVLYNLAYDHRQVLDAKGEPPDDRVFALVELCLLVCERFNVGGDSAQAEISAARWALEAGNACRARDYLVRAERILRSAEATYDQACFLLLRAQIEIAQPHGSSDPVRDLGAAEGLFDQAGDIPSKEASRRLRAEVVAKRRKKSP
jgi:hypothetical protein